MEILIVSPIEYGKLIDHIKWVKYLSYYHKITHISLSENANMTEGINKKIQIFEKQKSKFIVKNYKFLKQVNNLIKNNNFDCIIIDYFPCCSLIKLANFEKKMIVDIRTATVSDSHLKKFLRDLFINVESRIFDKITIISESVGIFLKLPRKNLHILPLGADKVVVNNENFDDKILKLLYVGSLTNRDIDKTILAVKKYVDLGYTNIRYTIIGFANKVETEKILVNLIKENNLEEYVDFVGRINHNELAKFYEKHNIGLSFIPIKPYFDLQPPTKTFEYIINGLFCIATNTKANQEIVTEQNGLLVNDEVDSLCNAFIELNNRLVDFDFIKSSHTLNNYQWENIVKDYLIPLL